MNYNKNELQELKSEIYRQFKNESYDIFLLGNTFKKDIDFVFICKNQVSFKEIYSTFICKFKKIVMNNFFIITKRIQLMNNLNSKNILHLLFYPNYECFMNWELPSFWASVVENSELISGNYSTLKKLAHRYYDFGSNETLIIDIQKLHYHDITKDLIFDLEFNFSNKKIEFYYESIEYLLKYSLIDIAHQKYNTQKLWNTSDLITFIRKNNLPEKKYLNFLINPKILETKESIVEILFDLTNFYKTDSSYELSISKHN